MTTESSEYTESGNLVADEPERMLPEHPVLRSLVEQFEEAVWEPVRGQERVVVPTDRYLAVATAAKEAGFDLCADVTAVDWLGRRRTRFEVVLNLVSRQHVLRLRIHVPVPADEPTVSSVVPLWPGASFGEREVFDMFGIRFEGHPDLTRILMPDDWEGHPLRKDFGVGAVPVQFKESHQVS